MLLADSRRLTGRNLLLPGPGAVLDVYLSPGESGAAVAGRVEAWRQAARRMLDTLGWQGEEIAVRRFGAGASLALSAPPDALYTATEINEWAWAAAAAAAASVTAGAASA